MGVQLDKALVTAGKLGHIVVDTLLPMMFLGLCKLGNICCGHKFTDIFCVSDTKFVSATMCPRLPGPIKLNMRKDISARYIDHTPTDVSTV